MKVPLRRFQGRNPRQILPPRLHPMPGKAPEGNRKYLK
jgi:hypothetical protein